MRHRRTSFPKHTKNEIDRHGKLHCYFRLGRGKLARLPDPFDHKLDGHFRGCSTADLPKPWSDAYWAAYRQCLDGKPPEARPATGASRAAPDGSVERVLRLFFNSVRFNNKAMATQQKYRRVLTLWGDQYPNSQLAKLTTKTILQHLFVMKPGNAADLLKGLRLLCKFAIKDGGLLDVDPTLGIELEKVKTAGHHTWTDDELAVWFATFPVGSKAHTAVMMGVGTAQRRGDLAKMTWADLRGDGIHVVQQKTGWEGTVAIGPDLAEALAAAPRTDFAILGTNARGRPLTGQTLGAWFRKWRDQAGLPKQCTLHGLRKAFVRLGFERGVTPQHLQAQTGQQDLRVLQGYGKKANQPLMARAGVAKIGTLFVQPPKLVGQNGS
jgi:enterobacteria phage integrase